MSENKSLFGRVYAESIGSVNEALPDGVKIGFGTVYFYRTHKSGLLERISDSRVTQSMSRLFTPTLFVTMFITLALFAFESFQVLMASDAEPTAANNPQNMVAVPGFNEFLPLFAGLYILIGLLSCAIIHEAAHGVAMMIEDVELKEYGIGLLLIIPLAAYVLPDEDAFENISPAARVRVFSAGVFANMALTVLTTIWFLLPWTGGLIQAFVVYFAPIFGGQAPTPELVNALGPITNTMFWVWFFNLNIGLLNALPVAVLDGGRIMTEIGDKHLSTVLPSEHAGTVTLAVTSSVSVVLFFVALFGPYFF